MKREYLVLGVVLVMVIDIIMNITIAYINNGSKNKSLIYRLFIFDLFKNNYSIIYIN